MNRQLFNAMAAQYATPEVSGDGLVSWDGGKKCVIPSVKLYGAAVQDGTPTPDAPVMPVCNNGVFVSQGRNLIKFPYADKDKTSNGVTFTVNPDRSITVDGATGTSYSHFQLDFSNADLTIGKTYSLFMLGAPNNVRLTFGYYKTDGSFVDSVKTSFGGALSTFTAPDSYVKNRIYCSALPNSTFDHIKIYPMLIPGDVPLESYTPYYDGGQAQAPELWAIPGTEYRDEWDPQTGRGIRRVKKLVLDGTESGWTNQSNYDTDVKLSLVLSSLVLEPMSNRPALCSHFEKIGMAQSVTALPGTFSFHQNILYSQFLYFNIGYDAVGISQDASSGQKLAAWQAYLAAQYAAGAPVTIWYALATPEPFYDPPAKLTMPTGFGQIIQTGGDVANCPIKAKYLKHR